MKIKMKMIINYKPDLEYSLFDVFIIKMLMAVDGLFIFERSYNQDKKTKTSNLFISLSMIYFNLIR